MSLRLLSLVAIALSIAPAAAQRGRRDEFADRYQCWFVDARLPPADGQTESKARLASVPLVADAKDKGQLAFLYLYDSSADEPKREAFDQIVFGNQEVGIALRCFRCARVDIAGDAEAQAKFGRKLPLFVAFDDDGKYVGETSLPGYKAALRSLTNLLDRAAAGHVKPTPADFAKNYRDILRDLRVLHGRRQTLQGRTSRADPKKKAELEKEWKELEAEEKRLAEAEKKALELANVPPRDADAKVLGSRERGRR